MRIQSYAVRYRDTECAECAYPFDVGDRAFIVLPDDDETTFCTVNCATRYTCDRSLQVLVATEQARQARSAAVLEEVRS